MEIDMSTREPALRPVSTLVARGWIILIASTAVVFSLSLACVMPFVALAAVSTLALPRRMAAVAVIAAWAANQCVGYGVLGYPRTWDSYAWGLAIGIAAVGALLVADVSIRMSGRLMAAIPVSFVAAYLVYEAILFSATSILPSGSGAFSLPVMAQVFGINLLAAVGFALLYWLAALAHLFNMRPQATTNRGVGS
jgi:hypothetical protein